MSATAFDDVRDLYQEIILDRGRHPRHGRPLEQFDATAKGDNPMCGDRVQVYVRRSGEGTVADVGFVARGCAISVASADLMADAVVGQTRDDVGGLFEGFSELVRTGTCPACSEALADLMPLGGVHNYPSRMKCATLPWHALMAALDNRREASSE
jgi:nitrogen fixation protein NifU and related proteins